MEKLLLAYYGDDFTGSTDALEFLCRAGAKTALFIEPPTLEQLQLYPNLDAIGVAGKTRALAPIEMGQTLTSAFEQLKILNPKHVHYKVCSTFDSSASIGSIGKAIDIGSAIFNSVYVPIIGGTPHLGRYCVFGNLFARMGIGSKGNIHRLDRHPSMSRHPVTPMHESDLRVHLHKQTDKKIGLIDILQLDRPVDDWQVDMQENDSIILVDVLHEHQLIKIGEWLDSQYENDNPVFSVGGSSVEMALGKYWYNGKVLSPKYEWPIIGEARPLLVISGSCSPVTATQIAWALAHEFHEIVIDATAVCDSNDIESIINVYVSEAISIIQENRSVIVHTGHKTVENLSSEKLGTALGLTAKAIVEKAAIKRVVISGGDTSSYAARAMEIEAVEMMAPLVVGAPLCQASSKNMAIHGLEVNFKGGQVGGEDYFGVLLSGKI